MISELRTFVAVARHGTFLAAGEKIGLTQSAVSGQIKRLEELLGFSLFDRTGRSAVMTVTGAYTLERVKVILALIDALPDADDETGTLRIGSIQSQIPLLSGILGQFRERYPKFRVHVSTDHSIQLLSQVDAGELDFAIVRTPFDFPPELLWHSLLREPYVLIAPASVSGDDWQELLKTQPFLRQDRLSFGGRQINRFLQSLPFDVLDTIEMPGSAMIKMVESGFGVAIISLAESHRPLPQGVRAISLNRPDFVREVGLIQRRKGARSPAVDYLVDCLLTSAEVRPEAGITSRET
ncbi:LysR family transcriptional regulator [Novosphingobium flavum]|uniref:LysR family transcriptional regulator n=2 Tax=Novosphingobium flavum TaxID=1778672 RepID=A0A7X1FR16_9SPHN|nr:LysR family transcriptional regulator [Novosphingobium flavum]